VDCRAASDLVHRYVDGEVNAATASEIDEHVDSCPACRPIYERHRAVQRMVRRHAARHTAPAELAARIGAALDATPVAAAPQPSRWRAAAMAASIVLAMGLSSGVTWIATTSGRGPELRDELVASHVRSLMADHLTDVASSDQHTVKPWFNGRIDLAPPVVDLAAQGFPLVGGRLDYLNRRAVAALVYKRRQHVINLFVMPADGGVVPAKAAASLNGYNLRHWRAGALRFWAVSDLSAAELADFERLVRVQP
jgi:mycothiol system anti-sigma-R factor